MRLLRWSYSLQTKVDIRQYIFNIRKTIAHDKRFVASTVAADQLTKTSLFRNSQHIACYLAQENEFDCASIISKIWEAEKNCYLPILSDLKTLAFAPYKNTTPLTFNRYHIPEPDTSSRFPAEKLDLVLMPLVGFDLEGHRLGMGGGYYDRTFQFLRNQKHIPFLLGIAYELQKIESIPVESWDISMDGVLTEERLYLFQSGDNANPK